MSRILRELLGGREPVFSLKFRSLESATGNRKIDLKILSESITGAGTVHRALKLDPTDTTSAELYAQLMQKAEFDDRELKKAFSDDVLNIIDKLQKKAPITQIPTIKISVLKNILNANPPKKVMMALGFRSISSMMKRAPVEQLLLGSLLLESVNWHKIFLRSLRRVKQSDITLQLPRAVVINPRLLKNGRYSQVIVMQCAGLVGVPKFSKSKGSMLLACSLLCEGLYHLHVRGVLLKLMRFDESCGRRLANYTYVSPEPIGQIKRTDIPWISCYLMMSGNKQLLDSIPEGVVEQSDFFWRHPSQVLSLINQRINIWEKTTTFGVARDGVVSLNITDIAHNLYYRVPLSNSTCSAMRRGLYAELMAKYLDESEQKDKVLKEMGLS